MPAPDSTATKANRSWVLLAALVATALLLPSLLYPLGRDQAVFAYVGSVMARGGMPYRDAWDLKPPGIYLAYASLAGLAPNHGLGLMHLLRIADLLIAGGIGVLLAGIVRRCGYPEAAIAAAGWYACLYLQGGYWGLAQAEAWANLVVLGSIFLCLEPSEGTKRSQWMAIGVLSGMGALLKFTTVFPLVPFLLHALRREAPQHRIASSATALVGLALPLAGAGLWLAANGALTSYVEIQRGFVAPYTQLSASGPIQHLIHVVRFTGQWLTSIWLPALLAIYASVGVLRARTAATRLLAMLAGGLLAVWIQDKYFGYHWLTVLPAVSLLAAIGSVQLCRLSRLSVRAIPVFSLLGVVVWAGVVLGNTYRDAARVALGNLPYSQWLVRFGHPGAGDNSFLADTWAADYVRHHTQPGDSVLVWGFEPAVYLLADRRPPSRYFFNVAVTAPFVPASWRREFLDGVRANPPELVLCVRNDAVPWASGRADDSLAQLQSWAELRDWLEQGYQYERQIEDFAVYRRVRPKDVRY